MVYDGEYHYPVPMRTRKMLDRSARLVVWDRMGDIIHVSVDIVLDTLSYGIRIVGIHVNVVSRNCEFGVEQIVECIFLGSQVGTPMR